MFDWRDRVCWSGTAAEGSGAGDPPPPSPPPSPPPPSRQQLPVSPPPARHAAESDDSPPAPRRTPNDQIADLRAEAAQYRISLRRTESERDDAQARITELQGQIEVAKEAAVQPLQAKLVKAQDRAVTLAVRAEMMRLGLQDEDLIHLHTKMPDAPKVSVNDDFEVTGAKELAEQFKKWKPDYFKKIEADPPASAGGRQRQAAPPRTSAGGEPPPTDGGGGIDLRDKDKYPRGSPAYKAALKAAMDQVRAR